MQQRYSNNIMSLEKKLGTKFHHAPSDQICWAYLQLPIRYYKVEGLNERNKQLNLAKYVNCAVGNAFHPIGGPKGLIGRMLNKQCWFVVNVIMLFISGEQRRDQCRKCVCQHRPIIGLPKRHRAWLCQCGNATMISRYIYVAFVSSLLPATLRPQFYLPTSTPI